jgi:hypothetical protein
MFCEAQGARRRGIRGDAGFPEMSQKKFVRSVKGTPFFLKKQGIFRKYAQSLHKILPGLQFGCCQSSNNAMV